MHLGHDSPGSQDSLRASLDLRTNLRGTSLGHKGGIAAILVPFHKESEDSRISTTATMDLPDLSKVRDFFLSGAKNSSPYANIF